MPKARKGADYFCEFAVKLRNLMENKKKTQNDLAKAIGVSRQTISQYADGSTQPNLDKFKLIAQYFNVSADFFIGLAKDPTTDKDLSAVCEYTGLSQKAVESLLKMKGNLNFCEEISILSRILEHENFKSFLSAIKTYMLNSNLSLYRPPFVPMKEEELLADFFNCPPSEIRRYMEEYSIAVIGKIIVEIIKDIDNA